MSYLYCLKLCISPPNYPATVMIGAASASDTVAIACLFGGGGSRGGSRSRSGLGTAGEVGIKVSVEGLVSGVGGALCSTVGGEEGGREGRKEGRRGEEIMSGG